MNKAIPIPNVQAHCEQCEEKTSFQLHISIDVNKIEGCLSVEPSAIWFCTECHDWDIACDTFIGWSN